MGGRGRPAHAHHMEPPVTELAGPICETGCEDLDRAVLLLLQLGILILVLLAVAWWLAFFVPAVVAAPWLAPRMPRLQSRILFGVLASVAAAVLGGVAIEFGAGAAWLLLVSWWVGIGVRVHRVRTGGTP